MKITQCVILALFGLTLTSAQASAMDLICEGSAKAEAPIEEMGAPEAPRTSTSYRLVLSVAAEETPKVKVNAALTTTIVGPNGATSTKTAPVFSLDPTEVAKVININEDAPLTIPGEFQRLTNFRTLSGKLPAEVAEIGHVDCVAF